MADSSSNQDPKNLFVVREATLADLATLVEFILDEAQAAEGATKQAATVRRGIEAALRDATLARYWVLVDNNNHHHENSDDRENPQQEQNETTSSSSSSSCNTVVGSISINREWSDWHAGFYWWIQSMYLKPTHRGRGLMALLMDRVKWEAQRQNSNHKNTHSSEQQQQPVLQLRLYVHPNNPRAIRAYQKGGWKSSPYQIMTMDLEDENNSTDA